MTSLSPLDNRDNTATLANPAARRIAASLGGAVETTTDIAEHSARAFADLARSDALRMSARDLPRDLVTTDPTLVEARLRGTIVRAPAAVTDAIHDAFDSARAHPIPRLASRATANGLSTQVERDVAALTVIPTDR